MVSNAYVCSSSSELHGNPINLKVVTVSQWTKEIFWRNSVEIKYIFWIEIMENTELTRALKELSIEENTAAKSDEKQILEEGPIRRKKRLAKTSADCVKNKRPIRKCRFPNYNQKLLSQMSMSQQQSTMDFVANEYEKAESCASMMRKETALLYDDDMCLHNCIWDVNYIENSKRYLAIMERCKQLDLLDRCVKLPYQLPEKSDILKVHTEDHYEKLRLISDNEDVKMVEKIAAHYDAVYFNKHTFQASLIAAGCAKSLVESVCIGEVQNGMAIIRPPGHHAMTNTYCGFCFFNNVAVAAQYALDNDLAKQILIVDVDVHHGQATQETFYNSKQVLYFSIHRYEQGAFWPNLRDSNFHFIGEGDGRGYNINFPLNKVGLSDSDYLSIVFNILLPVAYEFNPDLIIVSAGYDACIGCPEFNPDLIIISAGFDAAIGDYKGEMKVTPAFYGHLITLLSGLANGKIAVCLEGGYFPPSLAEGVAMTLKALLGDACALLPPLSKPHKCVIDTINDLRIVLRNYWRCFKTFETTDDPNEENWHKIQIVFNGEDLKPPYPTRECYPILSEEFVDKYTNAILELRQGYEADEGSQLVCCSYDEKMLLHRSENDRHVEQPSRLLEIYKTYKEWNLHTRCLNLMPETFDFEILKMVHDQAYVDLIMKEGFQNLLGDGRDMYFNENTLNAIIKANECLLTVVDAILDGSSRSGAAMIRPPGHHAEANSASGFCFINNVAVAAQYILSKNRDQKILILDFDIHHGNGTQNIFYEDNRVIYLSIHKYFPNSFFPASTEAHTDQCGRNDGLGYNVNIALAEVHSHDVDYISIFLNVILPIAYSFAPDIILISAGFDAGINDPLGRYCITPECFGHFIQLLKPLANGRLILALEGGYNIITVKYSMNICIKTLLGDPLPDINVRKNLSTPTVNALRAVKETHKQYWPILDIDRKLVINGDDYNSDNSDERI